MKLVADFQNLIASEDSLTIRGALEHIDRGAQQIVMIVDRDGCLKGVLTDGDIRRALLNGLSLQDSASAIMNITPVCTKETLSRLAHQTALKHEVTSVVMGTIGQPPNGLWVLDNFLTNKKKMPPTLLMAGGKGVRLRPLTYQTPKPLIEVAGTPVLHRVLDSLCKNGFEDIFLSVNYLAEKIEASVGDGSKFGLNVQYVHEKEAMGTAGSIALVPNVQKFEDLLVMNADLIVDMDFREFVEDPREQRNDLTIAVHEHVTQIPFGVVRIRDELVIAVQEKPTYNDLVSAGIYCISNRIVSQIENSPLDMPDLINTSISRGQRVGAFPTHRSWIDIGNREDLSRASAFLGANE